MSLRGICLEDELVYLAETNIEQFVVQFKRTRDIQSREATRACIRYLADHGLDLIGQKLLFWLVARETYFDPLLDPDFLTHEKVARAACILRDASFKFAPSLQRQITTSKAQLSVARLERATKLFEAVGDSGFLISWLRGLDQHPDPLIRTKAAKVLCSIRPSIAMIKRQLQSPEDRVRANAVETLWSISDPEVIDLLKAALNDRFHRVQVNAIVGLYKLKVRGSLERLFVLAQSPTEVVRSAAIWGMNFLGDPACASSLRTLLQDPSVEIRQKAAEALCRFGLDSAESEDCLRPVGNDAPAEQSSVPEQSSSRQGARTEPEQTHTGNTPRFGILNI